MGSCPDTDIDHNVVCNYMLVTHLSLQVHSRLLVPNNLQEKLTGIFLNSFFPYSHLSHFIYFSHLEYKIFL